MLLFAGITASAGAIDQSPLVELDESIPIRLGPHLEGRVVVRALPGADPGALAAVIESIGGRVERSFHLVPDLHAVSVKVPVREALLALRSRPDLVAYAEPDSTIEPALVPNDPRIGELYGLASIRAFEAWDITTGSSDFVVAVIDGGCDVSHPDLAPNIWSNPGEVAGNGIDDDGNGLIDDVHGWNFINNDADLLANAYHGSHVAGTLAARGNNGVGVCGVAWRARLMPLKAIPNGASTAAIAALEYAIDHGVRLSNHSWTGGSGQALADAIAAARQAGHLLVAGAGNAGSSTIQGPANSPLDNVISVAAVDSADQLAWFSNFHPTEVDLAAPGVDIVSTIPDGGYAAEFGTSMATPHVTGVAALVWSRHPDWSAQDVRDVVLANTRRVASLAGRVATSGIVDAAAAVVGERPLRPIPVSPLPDELPAAASLDLRVSLAEFNQTEVGDSIMAHVKLPEDSSFTSIRMQPIGGRVYQAVINTGRCAGRLWLYYSAEGATTGYATYPRDGQAAPLTSIIVPTEPLFTDSFDIDRGWTVGSSSDTAAASGVWMRGVPQRTIAQSEGGRRGPPDVCFATGLAAGASPSSNDVDGGATSLTSPRIDLGGRVGVRLGYWLWYSNDAGAAPAEDRLMVLASDNDGSTWATVESVGPGGIEARGGWRFHSVPLEPAIRMTPTVRIRFVASDVGGSSLVEAAIDEVNVDVCVSRCAADMDRSGAVDVGDIFEFLSEYFAQSEAADINHSSTVTVQDVFDFLVQYFSPCP